MMVIGRKDIEKMTITSASWRTGWLEVPDYMQKFGNSVDLLLNYRCIQYRWREVFSFSPVS
jgi:hypothetical protein